MNTQDVRTVVRLIRRCAERGDVAGARAAEKALHVAVAHLRDQPEFEDMAGAALESVSIKFPRGD